MNVAGASMRNCSEILSTTWLVSPRDVDVHLINGMSNYGCPPMARPVDWQPYCELERCLGKPVVDHDLALY